MSNKFSVGPPRTSPAPAVDLAGHRAGRLRLRTLDCVEAYWEALRSMSPPGTDGVHLPRRAEIDPRGIESALANAFIADRIAPGLARFRVAGTALSALLGAPARGMPLSVPISANQRAAFGTILESAFATPALVEYILTSPARFAQPALVGRLLLLPLRGLGDGVDCLLGALEVEGQTGRAPHRFDAKPLRCRAIGPATQTPPTQASTKSKKQTPARGATPFKPRGVRPYLQLVKTD